MHVHYPGTYTYLKEQPPKVRLLLCIKSFLQECVRVPIPYIKVLRESSEIFSTKTFCYEVVKDV